MRVAKISLMLFVLVVLGIAGIRIFWRIGQNGGCF